MLKIGAFLKRRRERCKKLETKKERERQIRTFLERISNYLEHAGCKLMDTAIHDQFESKAEHLLFGTLQGSPFSFICFFAIGADEANLLWKIGFDKLFLDYPLTKVLAEEIKKRFKTHGNLRWDSLNGEIPEGIAIEIYDALYYSNKLIQKAMSDLELIEKKIEEETAKINENGRDRFASLVSGLRL